MSSEHACPAYTVYVYIHYIIISQAPQNTCARDIRPQIMSQRRRAAGAAPATCCIKCHQRCNVWHKVSSKVQLQASCAATAESPNKAVSFCVTLIFLRSLATPCFVHG